jgi:hypothetical protein
MNWKVDAVLLQDTPDSKRLCEMTWLSSGLAAVLLPADALVLLGLLLPLLPAAAPFRLPLRCLTDPLLLLMDAPATSCAHSSWVLALLLTLSTACPMLPLLLLRP